MFPLTPKKKIVLKLFSIALLVLVVPQLAFAANWGQEILWTIVNTFFGMLVWIGGVFLNTAVTDYVVGFGELYKTSGLGFSIDNLWSVVRDIFNLTFIFGLVFIGFKMIFNSSDSNAQRLLVSLVLAGLLVNFSLFITKTVIDFSNIAATQIAAGFESAPSSGKYTVSDSFMRLMGVTTVFNTTNLTSVAGGKAGYPYIFGSLILYIVTAFVFMAGAMLLIIRFVVLNIYMVLSPLMFLGMVFPSMAGVSREYWRGFLARAFFAPAYILMLYFSNQILVNMQGTTGAGDFAKIFVTNGTPPKPSDFSSTIPFFAMAIVFLIASLVIGQKMGAEGASNVVALGRRGAAYARRKTVNAATYIPRRVGQETTNRTGEWAEKKLNRLQTRNNWAGALARTNVVDRAARGATTAATKAEFGTGRNVNADRDYKRKTQARANQTGAADERAKDFGDANKALEETTTSATDLSTALDLLGKTIKDMTKEEKGKLSYNQLTDKNIALHLTDNDLKDFESSGNFSSQQIKDIKKTRSNAFTSVAQHGNTLGSVDPTTGASVYSHSNAGTVNKRATILQGKSAKEIGTMPHEVFLQSAMYEHITPQMLNERIRNGDFNNAQIPTLKNAIETYVNGLPLTSPLLKSWDNWSKTDTNGIRLGLAIP